MVIRATREQLDVRELPIELHPRVGTSKLSPFRDGWRHLRVILVYNPTFLFLLPGAVMLAAGSLVTLLVFVQVPIFGRDLYIHSLILGCLLIILGVQAIGFGLCARAYGVYFISEQDQLFHGLRRTVPARARARSGGDRRHRGHRALRRRRRRMGGRRLRSAERGATRDPRRDGDRRRARRSSSRPSCSRSWACAAAGTSPSGAAPEARGASTRRPSPGRKADWAPCRQFL